MVRRIALILLLLIGVFSCSREKKITEQGYQKELLGLHIEAMHDYLRALEINPRYHLANKRMGFLLSASQNSVLGAVQHLYTAYEENPEDLETLIKLLDLLLVIQDFEKYKEITEKNVDKIPQEVYIFLENAKKCLQDKENRKNFVEKIKTLTPPENTYLFYRCVTLCFEKAGLSEQAEDFTKRYRKNY